MSWTIDAKITTAAAFLSFSIQAAHADQIFTATASKDAIKFNSNAPIEVIVGHTDKIDGRIVLPDDLDFEKEFNAKFSVDLASIDTGIALRNEHMRDNFLETKKYPKAVFTVSKVTGDVNKFKEGRPVSVQAQGTFSIHGITIEKSIPVLVTLQTKGSNSTLALKATFPIRLSDYKIQRPQVVFQKLADTVFVTVAVVATSRTQSAKE